MVGQSFRVSIGGDVTNELPNRGFDMAGKIRRLEQMLDNVTAECSVSLL